MNCVETTRLLNAHADAELDLATSIDVEEHLDACAGCRRSFEGLQATRAAITRHAEMPSAPYGLRRQLEGGPQRVAAGRLARLLPLSPLAAAVPGVAALMLAGWLFLLGAPHPQISAPRVVYHISNSQTADAALRNLANHLSAAPEVKVVVVAHNNGVDFLLSGARDESGQPFATAIREFGRRGVEFRVCSNTLERRGIAAGKVIPEALVVPSGIAEIGRLQNQEGYAYLRL
ncbi:MAG: DsrE family protein [Pseudomonadota bacterium]|nr:DsrE family protein [Pseudomonadota bacterium]